MNKLFSNSAFVDLQNAINNGAEILPYEFKRANSIKIGLVTINKNNVGIYMNLDETVNSAYMKIWNATPSSILYYDFRVGNENSYYYAVVNNTYYLLRKVDNDAINFFKRKSIIDFNNIINIDTHYSIIAISNNIDFVFTTNMETIEFDETENDNFDIDNEPQSNSLSLFDTDDLQ